tara:strand:- start:111 stop:335 length:225 start_codon:yes stop_codon:yes gene_type:complete
MGIYLLIGFITLLFLVQDWDSFFNGLLEGKWEIEESNPHIPSSLITAGLVVTTLLMFIFWPLTVMYLIYKLTEY